MTPRDSASAGPLSALGRLPPNLQGALWVVKQLGILGVGSLQTVFARSEVGFCVILPLVWHKGLSSARTGHLGLHFLQAMAGTAALAGHRRRLPRRAGHGAAGRPPEQP